VIDALAQSSHLLTKGGKMKSVCLCSATAVPAVDGSALAVAATMCMLLLRFEAYSCHCCCRRCHLKSMPSRYYVHVAAEAWGLGHASHNEGQERVIKVGSVTCVI
jgi:hypothetical protein